MKEDPEGTAQVAGPRVGREAHLRVVGDLVPIPAL